MSIHSRTRRIGSTPGLRPPRCAGLILGLSMLAACGTGGPGDGARSNPPATRTASCQQPLTSQLEVRVVDQADSPVAGVVVTLSIEGHGDGAVATTDARGIASFAAVARCASVGIWISRGPTDLGFTQFLLRAEGAETRTVRIRL